MRAIEAMLDLGRHAVPGPRDLSENLDQYVYGGKPARHRTEAFTFDRHFVLAGFRRWE